MEICQSCGMDISKEEHKGSNADGTLSVDYCAYCYKDGTFANELTLEQYVEIGLEYSPEYQGADTETEKKKIKEQTRAYLSQLKRWQEAAE